MYRSDVAGERAQTGLAGQAHQHDHVPVVRQRLAVEGGQAGELARLAPGGGGEGYVRGVERTQRVQQVVRVDPGRGDREVAALRLVDDRLDRLGRLRLIA